MTLPEFTAWLDGFSDAMGDAPTPEQWAKIKAKLAEVRPFPQLSTGLVFQPNTCRAGDPPVQQPGSYAIGPRFT